MKYTVAGLAVAAVWYGATSRDSPRVEKSVSVSARASQAPDRWTWSGRLAAGKTVTIHGVNGDVSAEAASGGTVEVEANKHARRSDPADVRIEVVEHAGGVTICALYPSRRGRENSCSADGSHNNNVSNNDVTVDFTVKVPRGVHFEGNTVNGGAEAVGLTGSVELTTVNGDIRLETDGGDASGTTVNGSVTATVRQAGTRRMRFATVNGAINLAVPSGLSADLDAKTLNGSITSDFPIAVQGRMSRQHLLGRIGQGGRALDLETVNGSIRLRQLP